MRLSDWRAAAPDRTAAGSKVAAVVDPVLVALGADADPHCWIAWGEEPASRFTIFVPTEPGLIVCFVRANVPGEGPRATTKLVRWSRVAIGEVTVETQAGHRMISFQLESQILRGVDTEADRVAAFALRVIAAIDGRPLPAVVDAPAGRRATPAASTGVTKPGATKPGATKPGATKPSTTKPGATKPAAVRGSRATSPVAVRPGSTAPRSAGR